MFTLQLQPFFRKDQQFELLPGCDQEVVAKMVQFLNPMEVSSLSDGKTKVTFQTENSPENVNQDIINHFRSTSQNGIWLKPIQLQFTGYQESPPTSPPMSPPTSSHASPSPPSRTTRSSPPPPRSAPRSAPRSVQTLTVQTPDWLVFQTGHTRRLALNRIFTRLKMAVDQHRYGVQSSIQVACIWDREENRVLSPKMTDAQFFKLKKTLSRDGVVVFSGASVRDIPGLLRILRDVRFAHNCYLENLVEIGISKTPVGTVCLFQIPTQ